MSFLVRSIRESDYEDLMALAKQFTLLNLPADKKVLKDKIERSIASFSKPIAEPEDEYVFVLEDLETQTVIGTSLILAKHGTEELPHYYFKILEKSRRSPSLGVGFIHNLLSLREDTDGPTEIGGLIIDRAYRGRPEKLGRLLSLSRFIYMGLHPDKFQKDVLCELSPPLTDEGRSEFWEALGRRFTGMPYTEADRLSQLHKGFIRTLFPEEDIYLCLLDSSARINIGHIADSTRPAKHLLEKIGFKYKQEVDPFDGGPHFGAKLSDISLIKDGQICNIVCGSRDHAKIMLMGLVEDNEFKCMQSMSTIESTTSYVSEPSNRFKEIFLSKKAYCYYL